MSDWFTDLVLTVTDDVLKDESIGQLLELTDRVDKDRLRYAAVGWSEDLRTQFAEDVRRVDAIRDEVKQATRDALPREWQTVVLEREKVRGPHAEDNPAVDEGEKPGRSWSVSNNC